MENIILKAILYAALAGVAAAYIRAYFAGMHAARNRYARPESVPAHRSAALRAYRAAWGFIFLVEGAVQYKGGAHFGHLDTLFIVHLSCAVPFLAGFTALLYWTGLKTRHHAEIAFMTTGFFFWTVATGIPLIYRL